jgi:hypothetical protein
MKFKNMIVVTLSLFVAYNAHAEMLDHHMEEKGVPLPSHLRHIQNVSTKLASTTASANYASGYHGGNISATGNVGYQIYNDTSTRQTYYVDSYMCIANNNCLHTRDSFILEPHTNTSGGGPVYISAYMSTIGKYEDEAVIEVTGGASSRAKGVNTVNVM